MAFEKEEYGSKLYGVGRWKGRLNVILRVIVGIFLPYVVFSWIYYAFAREWHHFDIEWTWGFAAGGWAIVVISFFTFTGQRAVGHKFNAKWQLFLTIQFVAAVMLATFFGNRHFYTLWEPVYDFAALETYVNVNPIKEIGDAFLDAGQMYFKEGSHVDTTRTVAFKNYDVYCLAPIIKEVLEDEGQTHSSGKAAVVMPPSGTVDFFAVGMNCCNPDGTNFACADVGNADARSGLRVLEADHRPYYSMAAEAWSMKYNIPAKHPIFVSWLVDPLGKVGGMKETAGKTYFKSLGSFWKWNIAAVVVFLVFPPFEGWDWSEKGYA